MSFAYIKSYIILLLLSLCSLSNGQENYDLIEEQANNQLIISGFGGRTIPVAAFAENVEISNIGAGASMLFLVDKDLPLYAGFSLCNYEYGSRSLISAFSFDDVFSVYQQETSNNIFIGNVIFSARPDFGWSIKPYLEGFFGTINMNTKTELTDLNVSDEPFDRYVDLGTWSLSLGASVGLNIPIPIVNERLSLDLKCSYYKGTAVDYYVERENNDIIPSESIDYFEQKSSITDLILPQLGISFTFGPRLMDAFEE